MLAVVLSLCIKAIHFLNIYAVGWRYPCSFRGLSLADSEEPVHFNTDQCIACIIANWCIMSSRFTRQENTDQHYPSVKRGVSLFIYTCNGFFLSPL